MRRIGSLALFLVLAVIIYQLYSLFGYYRELNGTFGKLEQKLALFKEENRSLLSDLEYFKEPENLIKELRGRFNYKKPGEKLIIAVPQKQNLSQ